MKLRLFLAKSAEVQVGLLYALGVGWTMAGPDPSLFAICGLCEIPWDETNRQRQVRLIIVDSDERPFQVPTPTGDRPFEIAFTVEAGRPPGVTPGRTFVIPFAINVAPVPFTPGLDYVLRALMDDDVLDQVPFSVRPPAGGPTQPPRQP